jgi:type I restriction enzyme S subunit
MSAFRTTMLREIAELNPKLAEPLESDARVSFVPMAAVAAETASITNGEERRYCEVSKGYTPFIAGDLLVAKITPCFENGKIAQAALTHRVGFGSTEFHVVRPHPQKADARYLLHFLRQDRIRREGERKMTGSAGQRRVPEHFLAELEIPLPSLPEQRRIAEVLDRAEGLRGKRRAALAQLDELTQAIFLDMFGDPVMNPKGWPESATLGEVAEIVSGITKGRKLNGQRTREVPYLAVVNVQDRALNLSVIKRIEATEEEIQRYQLRRNDLLLTEGGDPDKLGRGTLWNEELPKCIHQNHVFRVRLTSSGLDPLFLNWLVGSQRGKRYFLRSAKQTTGIASINMTQLRGFPLLLPPLQLQQEFARRVAAVEKLKAAHRASLAEIDALFALLQHRAFRGKL